MELSQLIPLGIGAVIILLIFRAVIGAVKTSAKMLLWLAIAAAAATGWIWLQSDRDSETTLPVPEYGSQPIRLMDNYRLSDDPMVK